MFLLIDFLVNLKLKELAAKLGEAEQSAFGGLEKLGIGRSKGRFPRGSRFEFFQTDTARCPSLN